MYKTLNYVLATAGNISIVIDFIPRYIHLVSFRVMFTEYNREIMHYKIIIKNWNNLYLKKILQM